MGEQQNTVQNNKEILDTGFAEWMQSMLEKAHILGASVAVVDNGIIESAGYGLARLPDIKCTPDSIFRMASTSKAMGAAVMGLVLQDERVNTIEFNGQKERLTWSTPIKKILGDDFDLGDDYFTNNVTIEDALSNRSGVRGHDFSYGPWMGDDTASLTRSLRHIGLVTRPLRSTFQYNNTMFAVVGHVIEKLDGRSFDESARERLWEPLGMTKTFGKLSALDPSGGCTDKESLARGYWWAESGKHQPGKPEQEFHDHYVAEALQDFDLIGPAAAVLSTANDYIKWIQALFEAAEPDTESKAKVISHGLFKDLTTARSIVLPSIDAPTTGNNLFKLPHINPQLYSLGWLTDPWTYTGETVIHHPGCCQGSGSHVFLLPERKFGVVIMENGGGANSKIAELVGREIVGRKLGTSQDERRKEGAFSDASEEPGTLSSEDMRPEEHNSEEFSGTDLASITGKYTHPAYGEVYITTAPSASLQSESPMIDGVRVIGRNYQVANAQIDTRTPPLHFAFQGTRSWLAVFLLHTQHRPPHDSLNSSPSQTDVVFFTPESLWPHGDLQTDPLPNLPAGHGDADDPTHPFQQESVYESCSFTPYGAAFEGRELGIVLGRTESDEADQVGKLTENWRRKMVWFDKA